MGISMPCLSQKSQRGAVWRNLTSHNMMSVKSLISEGATPWPGKLGQNLNIKLDVEDIYAHVSHPRYCRSGLYE